MPLQFFRTTTVALFLLAFLTACGGGSTGTPVLTYDAFGTPQQVSIAGYSGDIMEPFMSRDEQFLFFNDNSNSGKILHYATYDGSTFTYSGEIGPGINASDGSVQGVPTMDNSNNFYYVDTKFYDPTGTPPVYITLFTGAWTGTSVTGVTPAIGLDFPSPGFLNFDLEVSPDGQTIWFNDGFFNGGAFPVAADIKYATFVAPGIFTRAPDAEAILANVNTTEDLEYAPAISADGLELFFTRLDLGTLNAQIYRVTRADTVSAFNEAELVSAIPGFAEGATFSQDEKTLYYHWLNPSTNQFELYRVTRP